MARKVFGYMLVIAGVVVVVIFLAADSLGIGSYPGINWVQILGAAIGAVVFLVGTWLATRKVAAKV